MIADVALDTPVLGRGSPVPPVGSALTQARFPARPLATGSWPATRQDREQVFDRLTRSPFLLDSAGGQEQRRRGLGVLLDWLSEQPGESWQERVTLHLSARTLA